MLHFDGYLIMYVSRGMHTVSYCARPGLGRYCLGIFLKLPLIHCKAVALIGLPGISANSAQALKMIVLCHWTSIVRRQAPGYNTCLSTVKQCVLDELCHRTSLPL